MTTGYTRAVEYALPTIAPDHENKLGSSGADVSIPSGSAVNSDPAPHDGTVLVFIPSGVLARVRIGASAVAVATDAAYPGPDVWTFPIKEGQRVSLYGDGSSGTGTVCMGRG